MEEASGGQQSVRKQIVYENTYFTGPEGYGQASLLACCAEHMPINIVLYERMYISK